MKIRTRSHPFFTSVAESFSADARSNRIRIVLCVFTCVEGPFDYFFSWYVRNVRHFVFLVLGLTIRMEDNLTGTFPIETQVTHEPTDKSGVRGLSLASKDHGESKEGKEYVFFTDHAVVSFAFDFVLIGMLYR